MKKEPRKIAEFPTNFTWKPNGCGFKLILWFVLTPERIDMPDGSIVVVIKFIAVTEVIQV